MGAGKQSRLYRLSSSRAQVRGIQRWKVLQWTAARKTTRRKKCEYVCRQDGL